MTESLTLGEPSDLSGFPAVGPPSVMVRVCRASRSTWWFSSDGSGRFDLTSPEGTCYFATDAYAALREASRLGPVTPAWASSRELRTVRPPDPSARLAATTRRGAGRFGVTSELVTVVPYGRSRRWATALREQGFDGLRHELSHDQRARPSGISWFGTTGSSHHPDGAPTPITVDGLATAGVTVLPPPRSAAITIIG